MYKKYANNRQILHNMKLFTKNSLNMKKIASLL